MNVNYIIKSLPINENIKDISVKKPYCKFQAD